MTYTPGSEAKMVMALAALDIDATKVPNITSDTLDNLVSEIYNADLSKVSAVTQIPYILYVTYLDYMMQGLMQQGPKLLLR